MAMTDARQSFTMVYSPQAEPHLAAIDQRHGSMIRREIETLLVNEPDTRTRNRKPLREPAVFEGAWEIRFGPDNRFRVFYDVNRAESEVHILAIGIKRRNRLCIGGEEVDL
jgi:mRNA-degrading endonuclease RelE of RelBE toxin-antitoxin system